MNGFGQTPNALRRRDAGKIATTGITNELADALMALGFGVPEREPIGYRYAPYIILSSEEIGTNQWEYTVAPTTGGGSNYTGRQIIPGVTHKARNAWEEGTRALYSNPDISGILPIPDNSPIDAYWTDRAGGEMILLFKERNEGTCE
jgi:hypothetical protein